MKVTRVMLWMRWMLWMWMVGASATAEASEWRAGLNLRSELGTHPIRVDGGVRLGRVELIAVFDPMFWTDGEVDVDAIAAVRINDAGYAVLGGWRSARWPTSAIT